ncbi:SHD1 domain-containing protein [Aeoliella sp.]|uniref:SHD1 domain-containing protein n=1 Tax=Aeoliella sp. TaxID=2795800 RepID=UPI003CCB8F4A
MRGTFGRFSTLVLAVGLWMVSGATSVQAETYNIGDRVEVKRGYDWLPGTVVGGSGTRISVRLDDEEGKFDTMSPEMREKRLTRNYFVSSLRHAKGSAPPPPSTPATSGRTIGVPPSAPSASPFGGMSTATSRTWSDQSGRFSIDATYRGMNGDKVVLEKSDRSRIEVPLDKLSAADQDYVNSQGGDADNPFAVASTPPAMGSAGPTVLKADKSSAQTLTPQTFDSWTFAPQSSVSTGSTTVRPRTITLSSLPDSNPFFEDFQGLYLSSSGERAVLVREQGVVAQDKLSYLELFDLVAGKAAGLAPMPKKTKVLAVDPDQGLIAYREDEFHGGNTELTVAELRGSQIVPMAVWEPYLDEDFEPAKDTEAAWFLPERRIMTLNNFGKAVTIWSPATARASTVLPVSHGFGEDDMAFSPDRRYTALKMRKGIAIVDLVSGEHVATIDFDDNHGRVSKLAFNADNTKLAGVGHDEIYVWNLTTGELERAFEHDTVFPMDGVEWAGDFVFHRNKYLYDVHRRVLLWEFTGTSMHGDVSAISNGVLCMVNSGRGHDASQLRCTSFPTAEMIKTADGLGSPESLIVTKAGDPVAIELDIDERIISADQVRTAIVANLEAAGYVVADEADTVVKAVCKQLPSQTIKIGNRRSRINVRPEDVVERTIVPSPSSLVLSYKGQAVWRRSNMGQPGMTIWLRDGESLDQALTRLTTPNTKLLTDSEFPKEIIRPGTATSNGAYGVTNLSGGAGGGGRFE